MSKIVPKVVARMAMMRTLALVIESNYGHDFGSAVNYLVSKLN